MNETSRSSFRLGLLTSVGVTLDAFFQEIVDSWRSEGVEVFPAAGTKSNLAGSQVIPGLTRRPSPRNLRALVGVREWTRSNGLDVLITNTATASAVSRAAGIAAPVVYFCHGLHWNSENALSAPARAMERLLLRRSAGVITLNSDDESWFISRSPRLPRLRLDAGVGLDTQRFLRTAPRVGGTAQFLWIGEFSERKNPLAAVRILAEMHKVAFDGSLTMLGSGPKLNDAKRLASQLGISQMISFPGQQDPIPFLVASNAVIHTANWEGLPRVLLEAVAVGRPVYAFDVKGVRDVPTVHLVSDGDIEGFARRVIRDISEGRATSFPEPDSLSFEVAARRILDFARSTVRSPDV